MANTIFQLRRNTVSGTRPTTSSVSPGELAINTTDGILFSANATTVFEAGGNLTSTAIGNSTFRSTINSSSFSIANTVAITANGSNGSSGQVLTSNGTGVYWTTSTAASYVRQTFTANATVNTTFTISGGYTVGYVDVYKNGVKLINGTDVTVSDGSTVVLASAALSGEIIDVVGFTAGSIYSINTAAQYTWTNTHTFQSNVTFTSTTTSGNASIAGVANVTGNVTLGSSAFFVGNGVYLTTVNATSVSTGTLPMAQLNANVVNTSASFTITGIHTYQANILMGNTTVNTQISNATILISNSTTTTTVGLTDIRVGNTTTNVVISNTTSTFGGNVVITGTANVANLNTTSNVMTIGTAAYFVAGGNVGIGNTAPSAKLEVTGVIKDIKGDVRTIVQNSQTTSYTLVANDAGKHVSSNAGVTVPNTVFNAGDVVTVYNNSAASITITQGTGVTMYLVGTATTGNRTLAQRGLCSVFCTGTNAFVISGGGLS